MIKAPRLILAVIALVSIIGISGVWKVGDISAHAAAMAQADAIAAVARSQGWPIFHLGAV